MAGVWQKASNGETLFATNSYDEYGRLVRQSSVNLDGRLMMSRYDYTFTGELLEKHTSTYRLSVGGVPTRLSYEER